MTTGAPIYLVSACTSGEEFVAAFRRYADRTGLFVPIADPIAVGRKGRFALTLRDGSVMVEGEAEVISSAKTPSVLHGRVGMTIRFSEPDAQSKTVLVELEKARLVPKPAAPSVPPRPADVPPTPRPVPPAPGGRIDANNALAECVAIGNLDALAVAAPQAVKPGPRFVVPTIPPVGGVRPKPPTMPPFAVGKPGGDTGGFAKPSDSAAFRKPAGDTGAFGKPSDSAAFRKPADTGAFAKPGDPGGAKTEQSGAMRKPPSETGGFAKPATDRPRSPTGDVAKPAERSRPPDTGGFARTDPTGRPRSPTGDVAKPADQSGRPRTQTGAPPPAVPTSAASRKPAGDTRPPQPGATTATPESAAFRKAADTAQYPNVAEAIPQPVEPKRGESGSIRRSTDPGLFASANDPVTKSTEPRVTGDSGAIRKSTDPGLFGPGKPRKPVMKTQAVAIAPPPAQAPQRGSITRPPPLSSTPTPSSPFPIGSPREEIPTPTTTTTVPPSPLSDTMPAAPSSALSDTLSVPPSPLTDTMSVQPHLPDRGGPLSTTHAIVLERGYSETMDVAIGDVTGASPPLEDLDDVIPPPPPVSRVPTTSPNDTSGITAIAPPPKPEPEPPKKQETPEDLLTTIRTPRPQMDLLTTMRSTAPPMPPIIGTPPPALEVEIGEPTDLTDIPTPDDVPDPNARRTEMGVAVVPGGATMLPAAVPPPSSEDDDARVTSAKRTASPARVMSTPQVEEATPSGDWTMIPGAQGPTIAPREPEPTKPAERLTGDWSIQIDIDAPDGWSPPSKVEKIVPPGGAPAASKPDDKRQRSSLPSASIEPISERPVPDRPEEPKVHVDPTLIEPLQPMPVEPATMFATLTPLPLAPISQPMAYPTLPPQAHPVALATGQHAGYAMHAGDSGASFFHEHVPRPQDSTSVTDIGRRKRLLVILISAAIVVAIGIALLVVLGVGGSERPTVTPIDKATAPDAATAEITPDAAAVAAEQPNPAPGSANPGRAPPPPACSVKITSVPSGAEIMRDTDRDTVLGTTPTKLELPCSEVKLLIRKKGFVGEKRVVTPTADGERLEIAFQKNILVIKVSSTPAGATITMGGKNLGITPATIKLPAFEASTITIAKDGYASETRKVVPKANNTTVHAALTKKRR